MKTLKLALTILAGLFISAGLLAQYEVGDKVEDFKLENTDGEYVSLSDYENAEGFIIAFTCNTCPFARKYEDRIIALHNKYANKGYPVVAINPNCIKKKPGDSMDAMKKRADEKEYNFAYLKDYGQKVTQKFGAERTPEIYLLDKRKGELILVYTGTIDNNVDDPESADEHYVSDAVNALIAGEDLSVNETKAVGCTIKFSEH